MNFIEVTGEELKKRRESINRSNNNNSISSNKKGIVTLIRYVNKVNKRERFIPSVFIIEEGKSNSKKSTNDNNVTTTSRWNDKSKEENKKSDITTNRKNDKNSNRCNKKNSSSNISSRKKMLQNRMDVTKNLYINFYGIGSSSKKSNNLNNKSISKYRDSNYSSNIGDSSKLNS